MSVPFEVPTRRVDTASKQERPDVGEDATPVVKPQQASMSQTVGPGSQLGRYVVIGTLGEGGMGVVLRAYDARLRREVALKMIKPGLASQELQARMVREAQAMAKLSHPHVVSVYDVEAEDGVVRIAMEFVDGKTLDGWQQERERTPREVVAYYLQAGRGLNAAHRAGLLHRDFKPANVLVSSDGIAKVTDFGIARIEADEATLSRDSNLGITSCRTGDEASLPDGGISDPLTRGGVVMGTPRYMAPEQFSEQTIDASVDQYAFCVSLWHALTGSYPFEPKERTARALRDAKRAGPPAWPNDVPVPRPWAEALRRGLAPLPKERWPNMEALLEALAYDSRRHRRTIVLSGMGASMIALGAAGWSAWAGARAERCTGGERMIRDVWGAERSKMMGAAFATVEPAYADRAWKRTKRVLDEYAQTWVSTHREACEAAVIRGERSSVMMDAQMACLDRAKLDLEAAVQALVDADARTVSRAHEVTSALRPLSRCADLQALSEEVEPPLPQEVDAVRAARARLAASKAARAAGHYEQARREFDRALEALEGVKYPPAHMEAALEKAFVHERLGQLDQAEVALVEARGLAARERDWETLTTATGQLAIVVGFLGVGRRSAEGIAFAELTQELAHGDRKALAAARVAHGLVLHGAGRYEEAVQELRAALEMLESQEDPLRLATVHNNIGAALAMQHEFADAEQAYRSALRLRLDVLGEDHPLVAETRSNLAGTLDQMGRPEEAEREARAAAEVWTAALGPDHPDVAVARGNLSQILRSQGRYAEAEAEARFALASFRAKLGAGHRDAGIAARNVATLLLDQGKFGDAKALLESTIGLAVSELGAAHPELTVWNLDFASTLLRYERANDALDFAEAAWTHRRDVAAVHEQAQAAFVLARVLWDGSQDPHARSRARDLALQARNMYRRADGDHAETLEALQIWLEKHVQP